jgi:prepilin peptidase CpaA
VVFIIFVMTLVVLTVTLLSCVSDVKALRIPNAHTLLVIGCFVPAYVAAPEFFEPLWHHAAALGMMFILTYIMFCLGIIGGGDSKLGTALALWVGLKGLIAYVFYMAMAGGLLGVVTLFLQRKKLFANPATGGWIDRAQSGASALPYGLAISFGFWAALLHTGFLHHQLNEVFKIIH